MSFVTAGMMGGLNNFNGRSNRGNNNFFGRGGTARAIRGAVQSAFQTRQAQKVVARAQAFNRVMSPFGNANRTRSIGFIEKIKQANALKNESLRTAASLKSHFNATMQNNLQRPINPAQTPMTPSAPRLASMPSSTTQIQTPMPPSTPPPIMETSNQLTPTPISPTAMSNQATIQAVSGVEPAPPATTTIDPAALPIDPNATTSV